MAEVDVVFRYGAAIFVQPQRKNRNHKFKEISRGGKNMNKKRTGAVLFSLLLAVILVLSGIILPQTEKEGRLAAWTEAIRAAEHVRAAETPEDGVYSMDGTLRHASADQNSMGNGAIKKPMEVWIEGGEATLRLEFVPLTASLGSTDFTGYLAYFNYFPDWEGGSSGTELPNDETPISADVESYYEDVYDEYNNPDTRLDDNVKGELYPHYMTIPVEMYDAEIWTQVYVPVMESIVEGNGLQYARLQLDWSTLTRTGDLPGQEDPGTDGDGDQDSDNDQSGSEDQDSDSEEKTVDKGALHTLLISAASLAGRESIYTEDSLTKLKNAIERAENVYSNDDATQTQVDTQVKTLSKAILNLEQKELSSAGSSGSGTAENSETSTSETGATSEALDFKNLENGTYSIEGKMYKTDKETLSMSNDAITHTIKLKVKDGEYTLTLDFQGLEMNTQFGYLGELNYFESGYGTDSYGAPTGSTKAVEVKSFQTDANGNKIKDSFGTNYPDKVSFPLIAEAKEDGWVPLEVFVPIMESIAAGSGTQKAYLKLELDSVASAEKDSFKEEKNSSSSKKNKSSSSKNNSSEKSSRESSSASGADTIRSSSSLPSSGSKNQTKSQKIKSSSTELQSSLADGATAAASSETEDVSYQVQGEGTAEVEETEEAEGAVLPSFMSIFAVLAGGAYKLWSRRIF